ncbi:MAG: HD domain-containing protein [Armatimonadetes bacterium]|nr:HD domain-containing protein [Armatimonadota bacterium]
MDRVKISDLQVGDRIIGTYAVKSKSLQEFKSKPGKFLSLVLGDATGEIRGVMWDDAEEAAELFASGDAVTLRAKVDEYRGEKQLVVDKLKRASEEECASAELMASTPRDPEQLRRLLLDFVASVRQPHLAALLEAFFGDEQFLERFCRAPAAKGLHHAYVSGLLEHTVGVCRVLDTAAQVHPELDRDLLITGGLLHDLGKIEELEMGAAVDYTDRGRLVGHIVITDRMVSRALEDIEGFPEELANRLAHLLLSHHGQKEYGAPVQPMTAEACALHYADNLDAHVQYFNQVIAHGKQSGNHWSDYQRMLDRYIYIGGQYQVPEETGDEDGGDDDTGLEEGGPADAPRLL